METTGLLTEHLELSGRQITVSEATYLMGIKRGLLIDDILGEQSQVNGNGNGHVEQNVLTSIYAPLAACSSGDIPSKDEFLAMREVEIEEWLRVARKLNPHWFRWMDEVEKALTEDDLKKKDKSPSK